MTAWDKLAADKANPQPTPPIGEPVVWYIAGDKNKAVAAQVTGIEGPGRLKLVTFPVSSFPQHKVGVFHVSNVIHEAPNATTKNNGSWNYPRGKVPKEDYDLHKEELARRETMLLKAEEEAEAAAARHKQRQEAILSQPVGQKKPRMVDPIPAPF